MILHIIFFQDIPQYNQIRSLLRAEIVNPLRVNKFVNADYVMKLRSLLENICSVKGLTSDEKDPEELINILMLETLKAEPLLQVCFAKKFNYVCEINE